MQNREVFYIIYSEDDLLINSTHKWMGKEILNILKGNDKLKCINVTHTKTKLLLTQINKVNNTNYE